MTTHIHTASNLPKSRLDRSPNRIGTYAHMVTTVELELAQSIELKSSIPEDLGLIPYVMVDVLMPIWTL